MLRINYNKSRPSCQLASMIIFCVLISTIEAATCPIVWNVNGNMHADKMTTVTSLTSVNNGTLNYQVTFPAISNYAGVQIMLGLTSFQSYKSTQFSYNTSISYLSITKFNITLQILGNSYFTLLSFQYLVRSYVPSTNGFNQMLHSCFLTSSLVIGSGDRSQIFSLEDYGTSDSSIMRVQSAIGGLKFINNRQASKAVSISTYFQQNSSKIYQNVTVTGKTSLQWICIYTFYFQVDALQIQQYYVNIWFGEINFNSSGLFNLPFYQLFQVPYGMFFGIKQLKVYTDGSALNQQLFFSSDNYTDLATSFSAQSAEGAFGYIFIYIRTCSNAAYFYQNTTYTCVSVCPPGKYGDTVNDFCATCDYTCKECNGAGPSSCSTCHPTDHRTKTGTTCPCDTNYTDVGLALCQSCSILMENCLACSSEIICTSCISPVLSWNQKSLKCACPTGFYFVLNDGKCVQFPGCINASNNGISDVCHDCNTTLNFEFISDNSTCLCKDYYELDLDSEQCLQICGDGINMNVNSTEVCDDSDLIDGDGCSSNCTIQEGFGCVQRSIQNSSICSPQEQFQLVYLYAQRIIDQNRANLAFSVSPANKVLSESDFNYFIQTTIPYKSISASYSYKNSILKISIQYSESIQLRSDQINITFDPFKITTQTQVIDLDTAGINFPLVLNQNPSINYLVYIVSMAIGGTILILSIFFVLINHKMIAVQLLLPSQLVVFGLASMSNILQYSGLGGLKYMNGYNRVIGYQIGLNNYKVSTQIMQIQYFAQFFLNFNYMGALILAVLIGYLPFKLYSLYKQNQKKNFNKTQFKEDDLSIGQISAQLRLANKICNFYIDRIFFTGIFFNVNQIIFCFSIQLAFANKSGIFLYNPLWSVGGSFIFLFIAVAFIVYLYQQCGKGKPAIMFFPKPLLYPFHLTMIFFFIICALSSLIVFDFSLYVMCVFLLIPIVYRIINCPYEKFSIQYFGSLYCLILPEVCFIMMSATNFIESSSFSSLSSFAILGFLILGIINSIVRFCALRLKCCNKNQNQLKKLGQKSEEDPNEQNQEWQTDMKDKMNDSGKLLNMTKQFQNYGSKTKEQYKTLKSPISKLDHLNQAIINPLQSQANYNMKQAEADALQEDEDQLTRLKRSLRADLKKRRGIVNNANSSWGKAGKTIKQN